MMTNESQNAKQEERYLRKLFHGHAVSDRLPDAMIQRPAMEQLAKGELLFTVPWSLDLDADGHLHLNRGWTGFSEHPGGTAQVGIQLKGNRLSVFIPHDIYYKWDVRGEIRADAIKVDHIVKVAAWR